jgi:sigma-B regulation protein RsbU (phosphoserine phosphatase)
VTAFYGILDPQTGTLTYSNAGHNPQYILNRQSGSIKNILPPTGMPLGVEENTLWGQGSVEIEPGDVLLLYTDGIPDAQNEDGDFYEDKRLIQVTTGNLHMTPQELQAAILADIQLHVGGAHQFDDITLLILSRNS